jgi:plastocyanin
MKRWLTGAAVVVGVACIAVAAAACGGDDDDGGTDADNGSTPASGGGDSQRLEIAAENAEEFTKDELSASAGQVTVVFDNRDDGVIHNIAFFEGDSADGDSLAATELEPGPTTQEVSFQVDTGDYFYHCETHPVMEGTLTVE